jgi:ribonucleotide reductase beta subunit family protein with ferritin-like domain
VYEKRFIAFIDILGFGSLVEMSANSIEFPKKILAALMSIQPENIHKEAYVRVNKELIPPKELKAVMQYAEMMVKSIQIQHKVVITYFSDSLVISAASDDEIASQLILDMLAKLRKLCKTQPTAETC